MVFMRNGVKKYVMFLMYICRQGRAGRPKNTMLPCVPPVFFRKQKQRI